MEEARRLNLSLGAVVIGVVAILLFGFLWLIMGPVAFIGPGHRGVEVDRGRVTGKVYTEGWYIYNSITKDIIDFDVRTHTDEAEAAAASNDQQDVRVKVAVTYRFDDIKVGEVLKTIGREKDVKIKILDPQVQEAVKAATAKHNIEEILDKRVELKQQMFDDLFSRLGKYGLVLQEVALKDIGFSEEFEKAIEHKVIAEQQLQQAQFEADAVVKRAEAKAQEQKLIKETLTSEVLQRLWIEKWQGQVPQVVAGDEGNLFFNIPK